MNQRSSKQPPPAPGQNKHETEIPNVDLALAMVMTEVKTTLSNRIQLWHGEPKVGKTVQANRVPGGSFFLKFEPGHDHIKHMGEVCDTWAKFLGVGRALYNAKKRGEELPFDTVIVDTAGEAFRRCQEHELRKLGLEHESDADFGKGYSMVENEFRRRMVGLCNLGFGVIMIAHSGEKTLTNGKTGNAKKEWTRIAVDFTKAATRVIPPMADLILFFCKELNEQTQQEDRVIKTRGTNVYQAGVRYPPGWKVQLPETIEMSYAKLAEAWDAGRPDGSPTPEQTKTEPSKVEEASEPPTIEDAGWIDVESSNVLAMRHTTETGLDVRFKTGEVYNFKGVPRALFESLVAAESVGSFFAQNIKGRFDFKKVEQKTDPAPSMPVGASFKPPSERKTGTTLERRNKG